MARKSFWAYKIKKIPVRVKFVDSEGNLRDFVATKTVPIRKKVVFYTRPKRISKRLLRKLFG